MFPGFQSMKLAIMGFTGLEKDALHIYVGLGILFIVALLPRCPLRNFRPLIAVLLAALAGEALDRRDDMAFAGTWDWQASLHDVLNTLFWPVVVSLMARFTGMFNRRRTAR